MKKWLIFGGGVLTGVVLTFVFSFIFSNNYSNKDRENDESVTWFDKPGDVVEVKSFKVFQVIDKNAALVNGQSLMDIDNLELGIESYTGTVYLMINQDDKYYYDDEVIKVPENKVARQVGVLRYPTKSDFNKTVPIIQIMNK